MSRIPTFFAGVCLFSMLAGRTAESAEVESLQEAFALARTTGRPILVTAGPDTCLNCKTLRKQLTGDARIAQVANQFIELKINTESFMWKRWSEKYKPMGRSTPYLFVVRADGKLLHRESGPPKGLADTLRQKLAVAGTLLTQQQLAALGTMVVEADKGLNQGDLGFVAKQLAPLQKMNPPGKLGSYATAAVKAEALYGQVVEQAKRQFEEAKKNSAGQNRFAGVLSLISIERVFGGFPELKQEIGETMRELRANSELAEMVSQAELFDRALSATEQRTPLGTSSAKKLLEQVINQFPGTTAAELAQAKLDDLQR